MKIIKKLDQAVTFEKQSIYGQITTVEDLRENYQEIRPGGNFIDTINALTKDVHPPFYYTLLYFWTDFFGSKILVIRSLSAVIGCLVLPGIYWFCFELFDSFLVASFATLLVAVSPFHVLYAQEARMYSLWTVTILLSSAALIRAIKKEKCLDNSQSFYKNFWSWLIYAITLSLGFYTYIFTAFIAISHAIYVFVIEKFSITKTTISYVLASVASLISFSPWLVIIIDNKESFQSATSWANQATPFSSLLNNWIYNVTYVFVDFFFFFTYNPQSIFNLSYGKLIVPITLFLILYSLYYLCKNSSIKIWLFIYSLIAVNVVGVILPDIISGGYASIMGRYFVPFYLGIEVAVAYLLADKISSISITKEFKKRRFWQIILATLLTLGIVSCMVSSQSTFWWNKRTSSHDYLQAAKIINDSKQPLIIYENISRNLIITHILQDNIDILLIDSSSKIKIPSNYSSIYFFKLSKDSIRKLKKQKYKFKTAYKGRKVDLLQLEST